MAITVKLQYNESEKNKITKTVTDISSHSCILKESTTIIDPVFTLAASLDAVTGANYLTVADFDRSYFITDIRSIRNGLVEISAHCDVLSSFATEIKACKAIVKRQENKYNLYLNDSVLKTYNNPRIVTKEFSNGFNSSLSYVFAVAGNS